MKCIIVNYCYNNIYIYIIMATKEVLDYLKNPNKEECKPEVVKKLVELIDELKSTDPKTVSMGIQKCKQAAATTPEQRKTIEQFQSNSKKETVKTKDTEDSKDVGSKEFNKLLKKVEDKMNSKRTKREQYAFLYAILKMSSNKSEYQSTGLGITSTKEYKRDKQLLEDFFNFLKEGYKDADGDGDKDKIEILTGLFKSLDMPYEEINNLDTVINNIIEGLTDLVKANLGKLMAQTTVMGRSGYSDLIGSSVREQLYNFIVVEYFLSSKTTLRDAAWSLAIGQSVGNPNVRSIWEPDELFEKHSCIIISDESELVNKKSGFVRIGFPAVNIDMCTDGVSQLLCQIMGGQLDIAIIEKCHVKSVKYPDSVLSAFRGPKYGIDGIREYTKTFNKPLLGGIVKPKVGIKPDILLNIKEDEIMSDPGFCTIEERVPLIMEALKGTNVIYSVCINADPMHILDRVKLVHQLGGNSVHVNFWSGMGVYKSIRELDLPLFVHFQKSGDKILTNKRHDYHIDWNVICELAGLMGVDFIHAGMWGGYTENNEDELRTILTTLRSNNVMPALSCGMNPGLVKAIEKRFGMDYMANVGGALHGHPGGTKSGAVAMRQSIDGNHGLEYNQAIDKWGIVE